jgi:hypothetical protein
MFFSQRGKLSFKPKRIGSTVYPTTKTKKSFCYSDLRKCVTSQKIVSLSLIKTLTFYKSCKRRSLTHIESSQHIFPTTVEKNKINPLLRKYFRLYSHSKIHHKKRLSLFPSLYRMSLTKLSWPGIIKLFPARESW